MLNFCTKSSSSSVYRTLGDKKSDSKCASALKFMYPWKRGKLCKCTHMLQSVYRRAEAETGGLLCCESCRLLELLHRARGGTVFPLLNQGIMDSFRNPGHYWEKASVYLGIVLSLRIHLFKSDFIYQTKGLKSRQCFLLSKHSQLHFK